MSEALQTLLRRIRRPERFLMVENTSEPSEDQMFLIGRLQAREWRKRTLLETRQLIRRTAGDLRFIYHVRRCEMCMAEVRLGIERYGGSRLPWFLDIINKEYYQEDPRLQGMPQVCDYQIGSYWTGDSDDTVRFIKDRMAWAEEHLRWELKAAKDYYHLVEDWDFDWSNVPFFWGEPNE